MAPDRTPRRDHTLTKIIASGSAIILPKSLCLDAGVSAVEAALEGDAGDLEAGGGEHRLEQPTVGAELGADVLGVVAGGVAVGWVGGGVPQPAGEDLARLPRLEIVDQVPQPQHAARTEHAGDPVILRPFSRRATSSAGRA